MGLIQRDDRMEVCKSRRGWEEKRRMEREKKEKFEKEPFNLTPHQIHRELDRFVIGQEKAKKVLSVAIYNHNKRLHDESGLIKKSNILLAGPTGCGKTLLAKTMAKILNVPFVIVDATSMTEAGYVGDDVEICLQRLLDAADDDLELAQKGISKGTGARGLRSILEDMLLPIMYDLPEQSISECIITKTTIHIKIPTIVKRGQTAASAPY